MTKLIKSLLERYEARRKRKYWEYWAKMTDKKAEEVGNSLAIMVNLVAAGEFLDQYREMKAAGLTCTGPEAPSREWIMQSIVVGLTTLIVWYFVIWQ